MTDTELLAQAMAGNATAAAELWRHINAGTTPDTIALEWVKEVAFRVVEDVLPTETSANRRAEIARSALGLKGRIDKNPEFTALVASLPNWDPKKIAEAAPLLLATVPGDAGQTERAVRYIRKSRK